LDFIHKPQFKNTETENNISETGPISILKYKDAPTMLGWVDTANIIPQTIYSEKNLSRSTGPEWDSDPQIF